MCGRLGDCKQLFAVQEKGGKSFYSVPLISRLNHWPKGRIRSMLK